MSSSRGRREPVECILQPEPRSYVRSHVSYIIPGAEKPYSFACEPPPGTPWENSQYHAATVDIADARANRQRLSVDREGFELHDAPTAVRDFMNEGEVRRVYYPEASELALAATRGTSAYVFDHLIRRRETDRAALGFGRRAVNGPPAANGRVHNDYTERSGARRLGLVLAEAQVLSRVRAYCIVNIWRSIGGPVMDTPLAVCDARTVVAADLVDSEVRYPARTGEVYFVRHSKAHRWSYFPQMDRHEALVFKQYDARVNGVARFTPHAASDLPDIPVNAPLRESIELRCLVVFD